jgi:hypothetical protein
MRRVQRIAAPPGRIPRATDGSVPGETVMSDQPSQPAAAARPQLAKLPDKLKIETKEALKAEIKDVKFEKIEAKEQKDLKPEKSEKNEAKEHKDAKNEKLEKNEAKEHKDAKVEKQEKNELKEHKDAKNEKIETKELTKIEQAEKQLAKEKEGKELVDGPISNPGDPVEQRVGALEQSVANLQHFITTGQRPDLSQGALSGEADTAKPG